MQHLDCVSYKLLVFLRLPQELDVGEPALAAISGATVIRKKRGKIAGIPSMKELHPFHLLW